MVRVRFAPSPTGYLHIGNGRTALFNWLFARKERGAFILRIEDTDVERSQKMYVREIFRDLRWLGVEWDEGPDVGGKFGPYVQSKRIVLYRELADKLLKEGKAYYCYCSPTELAARRKNALEKGLPPKYDNRCRNLTQDDIQRYKRQGVKPALRFKIDKPEIKVQDLIRGEVTFDLNLLGDFVIMKQDGYPSFHFAVVVDDCTMEITHVLRGEDHLSNTPRHLLLFEALGYQPPKFAHMSLTRGPDGERLSKRSGATSIARYRESGYLPEALMNYMALLGWSPKDGRELLTVDELIKEFSIEGMTKSSAIFDTDKLNWVDQHHIKSMDLNRLADLARPYIKRSVNKERLAQMIGVTRDHVSYLSQFPKEVEVFFTKDIRIEGQEAHQLLGREISKKILTKFLEEVKAVNELNLEAFKNLAKKIGQDLGVKGRDLYEPFRIALTGKLSGLELVLLIPILGKKECIRRIRRALRG